MTHSHNVIPAKAGLQSYIEEWADRRWAQSDDFHRKPLHFMAGPLDSRLRGNDEEFERHEA